MNEIYEPLDPGIEDAVMLLRNAGIDTTGSCDAKHVFAASKLPWISVDVPNESFFYRIHGKVTQTLHFAGYRAFTVELHYLYQKSLTPWKVNMVITFWREAKPEPKP